VLAPGATAAGEEAPPAGPPAPWPPIQAASGPGLRVGPPGPVVPAYSLLRRAVSLTAGALGRSLLLSGTVTDPGPGRREEPEAAPGRGSAPAAHCQAGSLRLRDPEGYHQSYHGDRGAALTLVRLE